MVGLNTYNDLCGLDVCANYVDLQHFYRDEAGAYSAKSIAASLFKNQDFQCGTHSAIADARFTRDLFYKKLELEKAGQGCPRISRLPKQKFVNAPGDYCKCKQNPYK